MTFEEETHLAFRKYIQGQYNTELDKEFIEALMSAFEAGREFSSWRRSLLLNSFDIPRSEYEKLKWDKNSKGFNKV